MMRVVQAVLMVAIITMLRGAVHNDATKGNNQSKISAESVNDIISARVNRGSP